MSPALWGLVRAGAAVVAGLGLTYAAVQVPWTATLSSEVPGAAAATATLAPVASAVLSCPGPESEGLQGVPPVAGTTTVLAATPPAQVMQGVDVAGTSGTLTVTATPAGTQVGVADARGQLVQGALTGASVGQVAGSGALAAGLAALQTTVATEGDDRAAVATACQTPRAELWLVAGGGGSTRRERVVLTNPGANSVTADVTVLGSSGTLPSANGQDVAVPPRGRTSLLVDALVGPETTPVVHVVASGGVLTGVVEDSWIEGATGRGADDAAPAADPATEQVVPAVYLDGPARLRVAVPGSEETVVQARALTKDGPVALPGDGVLRIPGGTVRELDLTSAAAGAYAIQVRADQPVVAGVQAERRSKPPGQSDFGWTTSTAPISVVAGTPLPAGATASVMLVATGGTATATIYVVSESGTVDARPFTLGADSVATLDVSRARQVWVRTTEGTVRAGVSISLAGAGADPLFALVPLPPAAVSATQLPVRQIPG
ncbi:MAG: DUF5719 family protein [Lapillicoccus sp.]